MKRVIVSIALLLVLLTPAVRWPSQEAHAASPVRLDICLACLDGPIVAHPHGSQWNGPLRPLELVWH